MKNVRFATPGDYHEFSKLWAEYKARKMHGIDPIFDEAKFIKEAENSIILHIDGSGAVTGLMNIGDIGEGTIKIFDWYAKDDCFEVEAEMLKYVEDIAKGLGFKRLMLLNFDLGEDRRLAYHRFYSVRGGDEFAKMI